MVGELNSFLLKWPAILAQSASAENGSLCIGELRGCLAVWGWKPAVDTTHFLVLCCVRPTQDS